MPKRDNRPSKPRGTQFRYKVILEQETETEKNHSIYHKHESNCEAFLDNTRLAFYCQIQRCIQILRKKDYQMLVATGRSCPQATEKIDDYSGLVVGQATYLEVMQLKAYWVKVLKKSIQIYNWLLELEADNYSYKLHCYLNYLIITTKPQLRELEQWRSLKSRKLSEAPWAKSALAKLKLEQE